MPEGFVYLDERIPDIVVDLRYYASDNFLGQRVDGYRANRAILSLPAATALAKVQAALRPRGLGLKIFDAYRPQRAVDHFGRWARDLADTRMKAEFYPDVDKRNLFKEEYLSRHSGHSRGSTVDLTIVSLAAGHAPLDMGSHFDFFGPASWPDYAGLTPEQRENRQLLRQLMRQHGFRGHPREWWHFTLNGEPWPDTYFDFPVE